MCNRCRLEQWLDDYPAGALEVVRAEFPVWGFHPVSLVDKWGVVVEFAHVTDECICGGHDGQVHGTD